MKPQDARSLPTKVQEAICRKAVSAVLDGMRKKEAAKIFGVTRQTIGKWINVDTMHTARAGHTATLLPNRNVLVAGGFSFVTVPHESAEIYQYTK